MENVFLPCSERWEGQPLTAPAPYLVVPHHQLHVLSQAWGLPLDLCFQQSSSFLPSPVAGKDSYHPCEVLVPVRGSTSVFLVKVHFLEISSEAIKRYKDLACQGHEQRKSHLQNLPLGLERGVTGGCGKGSGSFHLSQVARRVSWSPRWPRGATALSTFYKSFLHVAGTENFRPLNLLQVQMLVVASNAEMQDFHDGLSSALSPRA